MNEIYPIPGFAEPVSSWTHLAAAGVLFFLSISLLRQGTGTGQMFSLFVFAFSCVFLLSMSGVYHLLPKSGAGSLVLRRLDHAAIFVLIAGTFTPVHIILFSGIWRWGIIVSIWALAVTGITLKMVFFNAIPEWAGLIIYLALGWVGVISGVALWRKYGFAFIQLLLYGGIAYSLGAVFEYFRKPIVFEGVVGPHELFHIAVLAGISFHWCFVYRATKNKPGPI
jgi:channel protein (hemolysin III family)